MEAQEQEDYRGKGKLKKLSMKQIILHQIEVIMQLGSQEFRGGYEEETITNIDGMPQILKKYIEDGRQAFCNSVSILDSSVVSYVVDDDKKKQKDILKDLNDVKKEQDDLYKEYLEELEKEEVDKQELKYRYFSEKKRIYQKIFQSLMKILKRSDFFSDDEQEDK